MKSNKNTLYFGGALIALGVLFLLNNSGLISFDFIFANFFPLALITVGGWIIYKNYGKKSEPKTYVNFGDRSEYTSEDYVNVSHTFGDLDVSLDSQSFKGGRLQTTFGELHVNLLKTKLDEGQNVLNLNVTFGEIKISLAKELPVQVVANNVGGDIKIFEQKWDGLNKRAVWKSETYDSAERKLDIVCNIVFGDIKVR